MVKKSTTKNKNVTKKVAKSTSKASKSKKVTTKFIGKLSDRYCGPQASKKYPNAYTKKELDALAKKKKLKSGMTKEEICKALGAKVTNEVKSPTSKDPKDKKVKKATKAKATKSKIPEKAKKKIKELKEKEEKGKKSAKKAKSAKKSGSAKTKKAKSASKAKKAKKTTKVTPIKKPGKKVMMSPIKRLDVQSPTSAQDKKKVEFPFPSKIKLQEHQIRVVNKLKRQRGLVCAHAVGTGKTITSLICASLFLDEDPKHKVIVICPPSLKDNFVTKEFKTVGMPQSYRKRFHFYSYQKFHKKFQGGKMKGAEDYMFIMDEAHTMRTPISSKISISRTVYSQAIRAKKVLLLTATPVYNSPLDIINLCFIVRRQKLTDIFRFKKAVKEGDYETLKNFVYKVFDLHYPEKKDGFPRLKIEKVLIEMTESYFKKYTDLENLVDITDVDKNPWVFMTGMRIACNKIEECIKCEFVKNFYETRKGKMLIYSAFKSNGIELIKKIIPKKDYMEITGDVPKEERQKIVDQYNKNKFRVLIITKAGSEGLDLKETEHVIIVESSWSVETEEQVIGRARRYLSHETLPEDRRLVSVYKLIVIKPRGRKYDVESADEIMQDIMDKKDKMNKRFMLFLKENS